MWLTVTFKYNTTTPQDRQVDARADKISLHSAAQTSISADIPLPTKRESLFVERETHLDPQLPSSAVSLYGQDASLPGVRSLTLGRGAAPIVTNVSNVTTENDWNEYHLSWSFLQTITNIGDCLCFIKHILETFTKLYCTIGTASLHNTICYTCTFFVFITYKYYYLIY